MNIRLISHVNRDDDLIEAWLQHYLRLGVRSFHLVAHGGSEETRTLLGLLVDTHNGKGGVFDMVMSPDRVASLMAQRGLKLGVAVTVFASLRPRGTP